MVDFQRRKYNTGGKKGGGGRRRKRETKIKNKAFQTEM